jgi:hypothetical protein
MWDLPGSEGRIQECVGIHHVLRLPVEFRDVALLIFSVLFLVSLSFFFIYSILSTMIAASGSDIRLQCTLLEDLDMDNPIR